MEMSRHINIMALSIIVFSLLAASCKKEVIVEIDSSRKMLMNAQICASDSVHRIHLGYSQSDHVDRAPGATVQIYVDDRLACQATEVSDSLGYGRMSVYECTARLSAGDKVRIVAGNGNETASAMAAVPASSGEILGIDTLTVKGNLQMTIKVKDNDQARNYYRLKLEHVRLSRFSQDGSWSGWTISVSEKLLKNDDDPVLKGGRLGGTGDNDFIGVGRSSNTYCIFSDRLVSSTGTDITVYVPYSSLRQFSFPGQFDAVQVRNYLRVSLVSMDEAEFNYLSILNILAEDDYDAMDYLEQVTVPSNVEGGAGFVEICSQTSTTFRISDFVMSFNEE
jgi:hypothetical protein